MIEWVADQVVPSLAQTGLVSVFPTPVSDRDGMLSRPGHYLIRVDASPEPVPTITPITSRALDTHEPFRRVVEGSAQLWPIDASLSQLFAPGTSAIAAPLAAGASARAALTLFRAPDAEPFSLDDLMRLEALITDAPNAGSHTGDTTTAASRTWQPAVLTPSAHVLGLRDLMRDLIDGDTPYDVARRFARAAQRFFEAQSCVVYFVEREHSPQGDPSTPESADAGEQPRLQLAASVGSGVLLTPPWLEPLASAGPGTLFASGPNGTVLMATLTGDGPWVGRTATDDVLVALPLRSDGELVAILGMRGPERVTKMQTITAENFAMIGANALLVARRRDADQSSILTLRSELARNRLAHDATIAMFGAADIASGLAAHAQLLVPGLADGYLVYLNGGSAIGSPGDRGNGTGPKRIYSRWREHEDIAARAWFEAWVDHRLAPILSGDRPGESLPLLVTDPGVDSGSDAPESYGPFEPQGAMRSLAAVPLVWNGATFGALVLVAMEHVRRYGQRDLALIASLAEPVARLLSAEEARPWDNPVAGIAASLPEGSAGATLLADLATRFIGLIEIDEIARLTARALASHLGDWCVVELPEPEGDRPVRIGAHADPDQDWPRPIWALLIQNRDATRGPSNVLRSGQSDLSLTIDWVTPKPAREHDDQAISPALIPASSISAPILSADDAVIGTISCFRTRPGSPFTLDDLATLELVAVVVGDAIAIARTRRSGREVGPRQDWLAEPRTHLMAQLADGVVMIDQHQRITFANHQARQIHGGVDLPITVSDYLATYQPREVHGVPFTGQTFPLNVALVTETRQHGIWRLRLRDDITVVVVAAASPVRGEDGAISGAVLSLHDVTAIYEQEHVRQQYLFEISGEIRSPIASIKGWSQYLAQRTETPGETTLDSRAVDAIARQTRLLQRLVERLITASRSGLVEDPALESRPLDMGELLGQLVHAFQGRSPNRAIVLSAPDEGQLVGHWDPNVIGRIFGNLLDNAISSSSDGSPIEVTAEQKPGRVSVSVTDHGAGISPDQQQIIFEKRMETGDDPLETALVRSGNADFDAATGASDPGLDLQTVARLVRRLHGQISLRSTSGTGSTFTVELPLGHEPDNGRRGGQAAILTS